MNYNEMHWKQIEKLVNERGGEYTTKEAALVFLAEFDASAKDAADKLAEAQAEDARIFAEGLARAESEKAASEQKSKSDPLQNEVVFDKRLPYGEINGRIEGYPGAKYTQNGAFFNSQGKRIV